MGKSFLLGYLHSASLPIKLDSMQTDKAQPGIIQAMGAVVD